MPIRPPALDDRSFEDLSAEMLRRIPAHTPEWTNPQPGDPGRTIIELMAWLGDTILYRANLIPERQRLAFLKLLGVGMRPSRPARALVSLTLEKPTDIQEVFCPQFTPLLKPVHFETTSEMTVLPLQGNCCIKRKPTEQEVKQFSALLPDLMSLYQASESKAAPYITTPVFPESRAERSGIDVVGSTVDGCLWIALSAASPDVMTQTRAAMAEPKTITIGIAPQVSAPFNIDDVIARQPIPMIWEIHSLDDRKRSRFNRLSVDNDTSNGLTTSGVVTLQLPALTAVHAPTSEILRAGLGEQPPRLDDAIAAASVVAWIRLRPDPGAKLQRLSFTWVGINAVMIEQRETLPGRRTLGQGNGASDQQFNLGVESVDIETLQIDVTDEQGVPRPWRRTDDTAGAGRDEAVFSIDAEAGIIRFGDGVRGRAPHVGSLVQALGLRSGGGNAGNLPAGSIKEIALDGVKVNQPLPAGGGADAETLEAAERRIPQLLRHQDRAVSEQDFQRLALQTPGLSIGRVEVIPRFKPHQRRMGIPGVVSVMCLPQRDGFNAPAPRPDRPTLESVHDWLDVRRPLATELYVIGSEYVPLALSVAVELVDPSRRHTVLNNIKTALQQWLWALAPGGPTGQGWPLGRAINDRELEVVVARVEGVDGVAPVLLYTRQTSETAWTEIKPTTLNRIVLDLKPWQLPELLDVIVIEGNEADRAAVNDNGNGSGSPGASLAIPIVPEMC